MRWYSRWAVALLGVVLLGPPAGALPQPKLPPEAADKPSVVVRVKPLGELLKDAGYIANLVDQGGLFAAVEPGLGPVLEGIDVKRPIGFYARVRPAGIDSQGILMLPVKGEKEFLAILAQLAVNPNEGANGLYTVNVPGSPFAVLFRFANGYVYATVKNTPDAETALSPNKIFRPDALFAAGDDSVVSVTVNADAMPNELKLKALAGLEDVLRNVNEVEIPKEKNPIVRRFATAAAEEIALKVQALIVDVTTVTWRFDLDRAKEDMSFSFRMTVRKGSDLANDIASVGTGKGIGAGLAKEPSAIHGSTSVSVPGSIKKAFEPLVDELIGHAWRSAPVDKQDQAKEILDALAPTLKAGILDAGFDFRGPGADGYLSLLVGVHIQDGQRLEGALRKLHATLGEKEKGQVTLDVDKASGVAIHRGPTDARSIILFGPLARFHFAVRKDLLLIGLGQEAESLAVLKDGLQASPKASKVFQGQLSVRKMAKAAEAKEERVGEAARKAFPDNISDVVRFEITGGDAVTARFSGSSRLIQFAFLVEQSRRGR